MVRGRPVVVVQVALGLAFTLSGSHAAFAQTLFGKSKPTDSKPGIHLGLPTLNIPGVIKTSPVVIDVGSKGVSATLPSVTAVGGVVTTSPANVELGPSGVKAVLPSANVAGAVSATPAAVILDTKALSVTAPSLGGVATVGATTVNLNKSGLDVALPSANIAGLVKTTEGGVNLSRNGVSANLPGTNVVGLLTTTPGEVSVGSKGLDVKVPGVSVANAVTVTPTLISVNNNGVSATLSGVNVANAISVSPTSVALNNNGLSTTLPSTNILGVVKTPGGSVDLAAPATPPPAPPPPPASPGAQTLKTLSERDVITQLSPTTQQFAGLGSAEAFASVEQVISGLAFGNDAPSACANANAAAGGSAYSGASDIWAWNSVTLGRTNHEGYQVSADGTSCGFTAPFQTLERAQLPGVLFDASSAFGMKKGSLHVGFSSGAADTDTRVKASAAMRDSGLAQTGSTRMRSWSMGGFSLLTTENWYAGSAFGSAWGRADTQSYLLGSNSDYDTSTFVAAGFVGTVIPLSENLRFDVRGTLSYQRTVGDAHVDSLGLVYGDHTIEAADVMLSGRLFGVFREGDMVVRPFIQAGLTHHLRYTNQLEIDGIAYSLQEADTTLFAATGLDFEINRTLQLSVGVRHDRSPDTESVTGRFGLSLRLN
jgi:hypothetical protein